MRTVKRHCVQSPGKPGFVFLGITCNRTFAVCPTGWARCRTPVGDSHPPGACNMRKKSPYLRTSSFLNMAVRGGLTRFARPAGSPLTVFAVCPTGCARCRPPGRGFSSPQRVQYAKKKPVLAYELFLKYGGEGGIRTPDTLPYTHFPGVLLQPLGHLTILYCCLTAWGQRGATIGSCANTVKQYLRFASRLVTHCTSSTT